MLSKTVTPTWFVAVFLVAGIFLGAGSTLRGQDDGRCRVRNNDTVNRCEVIRPGDPLTYFKGSEEPPTDWNSPDFVEGVDWLAGGTPIGYGENPTQSFSFTTELTDMGGSYISFFIRSWITVENLSRVNLIRFSMRHDDGFALYLNGEELDRANIANGPISNTSTVTGHEFTERIFSKSFSDISRIPLVEGRNLVAVRVHNENIDSSDAVLDLKVRLELDLTERPQFVRGTDCDGVSALDIGDPVYLLRFQFGGLYPEPNCMASCDCNDDGMLDLSDAVWALNYLFQNGAPFPEPFPSKGEDRTADELTCGDAEA